MTYLRNIGAHNAYDVIQDGAEKVHERRTTNDKIGHPFSSTGCPRLGCVLPTSNANIHKFITSLLTKIFSSKKVCQRPCNMDTQSSTIQIQCSTCQRTHSLFESSKGRKLRCVVWPCLFFHICFSSHIMGWVDYCRIKMD